MKLLSIAVPCYNSEAYMKKCIDSLLPGREAVEILIINDGSNDHTAEIGEEYQKKHPTIVRVIHKENGGHGSAVNTGLKEASGRYFKVVDSDDWVLDSAYQQILKLLAEFAEKEAANPEELPDMIVSNFVYEKEGATRKKVMNYKYALPENRLFTWKQVKHFRKGQYILMHSVMFRTQLLKDCGILLPEHTFYVDNLFVFEPLPYVQKLYYLPVNFYRYYIGREGQSVNEEIMISRIDQQIRVNQRMVDYLTEHKASVKCSRKRYNYMISYLDIITTVSSVLLVKGGSTEQLEKKKELWKYIKQKNAVLYYRLRYGLLGSCVNLPGRGGRKISLKAYKICQRFFKFN